MATIEGFHVSNYRALKDVTLGRASFDRSIEPLGPLVAVIGKNGSGKSTLFDAFGFVSDCLRSGVEEAFDGGQRGGFERVVSAGSAGPISFEIFYRESTDARPIVYQLSIAADERGRPFVQREVLLQARDKATRGPLFPFLRLEKGEGEAWEGEKAVEGENRSRIPVHLTDSRKLGIVTLGALREHPRISRFRSFIEGWYLSYFEPNAARKLPMAGPQKHLNASGDNLANVVQFMEREHKERFETVLEKIAKRIPGIQRIDTHRSEDGRLLLRFYSEGFSRPFYQQQMSDGTLKLFTYMLLLEDPHPPPFICIEEPENGLYHKLLETLAQEFRKHAKAKKAAPQIFVTTHQPHFVDALLPKETWILEKGTDGFSKARRTSADVVVQRLVDEGMPLGGLWFSDYLDPR